MLEKINLRLKIQHDTEKFLNAGGVINKIPAGKQAIDPINFSQDYVLKRNKVHRRMRANADQKSES